MLKTYKPYLIIFIFGLALYLFTAFFDFSYLDDNVLIGDNYSIISHVSNIGQVFTDDVFFSSDNFYYRPLLNVSLMLDSIISGSLPWFFHLNNILFNIIAACLLFLLLLKLKTPRSWSLFFSLLFLTHPALVQAVAWIPGRNDVLLTIFVLSSFLLFLEFLQKQKLVYYILCIISFLIALFLKETALVLPFLFIFYYLFISDYKIVASDSWALVIGLLAAVLIWFIFRSLAISGNSLNLSIIFISIVTNSSAIIVGLGKFFLPFKLSVMPVVFDINPIFGIVGSLLLALMLISKRGVDKKYFAFGLLWFWLFFVPSLINPDKAAFYYLFEHRLYLPFIGLIIILSKNKFFTSLDFKKIYVYLPSTFILVLFIISSFLHILDFKNRLVFWQSAVASSPSSPMAERNLGAMLYLDGNKVEALEHYQKSLVINRQEPMAHNNIGLIYMDAGKLEAAEREFRLELDINPGYDKALNNLKNLLILKNQLR